MAEPSVINCPSCGGDVRIATKAARTAACPYCHSTLIVNEAAIRALGKMALLAESPSRLAVGWQARCAGREIMTLGRLQFRYEAGLWDEWWVQFADDQSFAWISQDEDEYILERPISNLQAPEYDSVVAGDTVTLKGRQFWVVETDEAVMVGMQGELPRDAAPDRPMRYIELTDNKHHVTLEYFEDGTVEGFLGRTLQRQDLQSLKQDSELATWGVPIAGSAAADRKRAVSKARRPGKPDEEIIPTEAGLQPRAVRCPNCGGTVEVRDSQGTVMVACKHCSSALDVATPGDAKLLYTAQKQNLPGPEIGKQGKFKGAVWTVLGRVRYREDDNSGVWVWDEFQIHSAEHGYAFLALENGHWVWFDELKHRPNFNPSGATAGQKFSVLGQSFTVFEQSAALVTYVEGELSWVARTGDRIRYMDAASPPQMVSAEWTSKELEWFLGRYMTRDEVATGFGIDADEFPRPTGVAPAQPFQKVAGEWLRVGICVAAAVFLFIMLGVAATRSGTKTFESGPISSNDYLSEKGYVSPPIEIPEGRHICKLTAHSDQLSNSWVALSIAFLDENEDVVMDADQTVEYYNGVEEGESWSEGSRDDYALFVLDGPKKYRLNVFGETGTWSTSGESLKTSGAPVQIQLYRDTLPQRYLLTTAVLCMIYPLWALGRRALFEFRRRPASDDDDDE